MGKKDTVIITVWVVARSSDLVMLSSAARPTLEKQGYLSETPENMLLLLSGNR